MRALIYCNVLVSVLVCAIANFPRRHKFLLERTELRRLMLGQPKFYSEKRSMFSQSEQPAGTALCIKHHIIIRGMCFEY